MSRASLFVTVVAAACATANGAAASALRIGPMEGEARGDVAFITGGVGEGERQALMRMVPDYPLFVTLARSDDGAYLAGVAVSFTDARGTEKLRVDTHGPLLLVDLPDGDYWVAAQLDGWRTARRRIHVSASKHRALHITMRRPPLHDSEG